MNRENPRRRLLGGALLALLPLTSPLLSGCDRAPQPQPAKAPPPSGFKSLDITGAGYARQLTLTAPDGQPRSLTDYKGKLIVVFFGYTQCPDVCPTTLTTMAEVKRLLGPDGDRMQVLFVSVDPERDTADLLKHYVGSFDPDWVGLRGTPEQIAEAAKEFKIFYRKANGRTPESYTVDHTAASYVFDTEGKVRLYVRHATPAADIAADLKQLLPPRSAT